MTKDKSKSWAEVALPHLYRQNEAGEFVPADNEVLAEIQSAQAEAVKSFAKKLKERCFLDGYHAASTYSVRTVVPTIPVQTIDTLLADWEGKDDQR